MIDPFHLEAYGETTVNYNRDIEIYPVLASMFEGIYGYCPYKSPTDMGVNMAGNCIIDDEACREASKQEIIRRYYQSLNRFVKDEATKDEVYKQELIMKQAKITVNDRAVVPVANNLATADFMLQSKYMSESYSRTVENFNKTIQDRVNQMK